MNEQKKFKKGDFVTVTNPNIGHYNIIGRIMKETERKDGSYYVRFGKTVSVLWAEEMVEVNMVEMISAIQALKEMFIDQQHKLEEMASQISELLERK